MMGDTWMWFVEYLVPGTFFLNVLTFYVITFFRTAVYANIYNSFKTIDSTAYTRG